MRVILLQTDERADKHILQYPEYLLKVKAGYAEIKNLKLNFPSYVKFVPASTDLGGSIFSNLEKNYMDV